MKKLIFLSIFLVASFSCQNAKEIRTTVLFGKENYDVVPLKNTQVWKPNQKDARAIISILETAVADDVFYFLEEPKKNNFDKYYKQLIPYIDENGDHCVLVNAFCEIPKIPPKKYSSLDEWIDYDWKNELVFAFDGGDCYWEIKVNLDKKRAFHLSVNGVA